MIILVLLAISVGINFALYLYICYLRGFKKETEKLARLRYK